MTLTDHRQQDALDAAALHIVTTATSVAERASELLGVLAQSSVRIAERDHLNTSQFELRRNMGEFQRTFRTVLDERIEQELAPPGQSRRRQAVADWQTLSLVDDSEMEERMFSDRIGQMIGHECDAELRELAAYMGSLLLTGRADQERNPLRAEVLGAALYRAIEAVSEQAETRKLLARELGQALAKAMPACYGHILADLQGRGVLPVSLTVRTVEGPGNQLPGISSGYGTPSSTRSQHGDLDTHLETHQGGGHDTGREFSPRTGHSTRAMSNATSPSTLGGTPSRSGTASSYRALAASQAADAQLMALLRRLTAIASRPGELDALQRHSGRGSYPSAGQVGPGHAGSMDFAAAGVEGGPATGGDAYTDGLTGLMAVNLIRAHREELMQASTGKLDHMVIDVVGSLFDQILSDTRVPPQMARQIARLQLPVLRVALNDSTFFSSRRHPVRRFVNRIASLACAFDDFDDGPGKSFLARVRELVEEIVEGDFDQIELYASKLAALESFISEQTHDEVQQNGAAATLSAKESELRLQQRYMLQLQGALKPVALPPYLRDFLPQVWSQALVLAVTRDGPQSDRAKRYRRVGCDLVMSVQPKGSPALRKRFLMQLPPLMKDLNEGLRLIGWPAAAQREFFGQLLPAHAESLKGAPMSELDHNLMVKQLQSVFAIPVPGTESLSMADEVPEVDEAVIAQRFTPEEAQRVGLIEESAVDWSGQIDVDLSAGESTVDSAGDSTDSASLDLGLGLDVNLDLANTEPPEPSRGPQLMEHIKLGFAYQMHLKDEWQKVRLAHVSAGRGFFVFTRGKKHQETISMTARMLARMCDTGRLRAFENAYLMERATQRARKQLAALKTTSRL
jgi:hypothetical protein